MSLGGKVLAGLICALSASRLLAEGPSSAPAAQPAGDATLWALAQRHADALRFSTLFTAHDVRERLSTPEGIAQAIKWCRSAGITQVYIEAFRDGYTAKKDALLAARQAFVDAGFLVSGCVTTTDIGRTSVHGWKYPCFTDEAALDNTQRAFAYAAGMFDEIMIDDFLATKCQCPQCVQARGQRSWSDFRRSLLRDVSRRYVLDAARRANPDVKVILKYPQWYEDFHHRGYDVTCQTDMFDKIWVGTETRDPDRIDWGRRTQYEAYFIMRWLGGIGGAKCGGGWFDSYGTSPATFLEQARQTVLGGAREAMLFCYCTLLQEQGPADMAALRKELPGLFELADLVHGREPRGIAAPKPPNSDPDGNQYIYDFIGLLGLPLAPDTQVRSDVPVAFLPAQAFHDPDATAETRKLIAADTPILMTRQFAAKLPPDLLAEAKKVEMIELSSDPWKLMDLPPARLRAIRKHMLTPLGVEFDAPSRVALYLFAEDLAVIENFNDSPVETQVSLRGGSRPTLALALPSGAATINPVSDAAAVKLGPRSLAAVRFER